MTDGPNATKLRAWYEEAKKNGLIDVKFVCRHDLENVTAEDLCGDALKYISLEGVPLTDDEARALLDGRVERREQFCAEVIQILEAPNVDDPEFF